MTDGARHADSCTHYLLQARPDRVSVQGFYADVEGVVLILSSADSVQKSPKLNLKDASQYQPLYAFVQRLYDPLPSMIDPTMKRRMENSLWVFDIMLTILHSPSIECVEYRIAKALGCVSRRIHIFCEQCQSNVTEWCRYYRHQRSVLLSWSSFQ